MVMPLESEIAALKAKLTSSVDRVKELEAVKVKHLKKRGTENQMVLFFNVSLDVTFLFDFFPFIWLA